MVTYQLEWRTPQRSGWEPFGPPADSVAGCTNTAAHSARIGGEQFRVVGLATDAQPDGSIVRRELSPDELAAAIRGEQVDPKPVKAVVFASDIDGRDALYVDGELYRQMSLGEDDDLGVIDCVDAAGGSLVKLEARWIQREIAAWPKRLADLRLDD